MLYNLRKEQRGAARSVVGQAARPVVDVLLEELDLEDVLLQALLEHTRGFVAHLVEQRPGVREAAGDQLGRAAARAAVGTGERRDDDQDAVLGEMAPVA